MVGPQQQPDGQDDKYRRQDGHQDGSRRIALRLTRCQRSADQEEHQADDNDSGNNPNDRGNRVRHPEISPENRAALTKDVVRGPHHEVNGFLTASLRLPAQA
jgi:hypothetical protein